MKTPKDHPRHRSLLERHRLVEGMKKGFVADAGLIAHGRGEAFDYLLGEKTTKEAYAAEKAAVALLLLAEKPVISVNGNVAALCPEEIVKLADAVDAGIEINLFYRSRKRIRLIEKLLKKKGAKGVRGTERKNIARIPGLSSERSKVDRGGIYTADVVLVPLEDGDRLEALNALGKKTIAVDLNPLSRTSQNAGITIVDNVTRALPEMIKLAKEMKGLDKKKLEKTVKGFDNRRNLEKTVSFIRKRAT